MINFSYQVKGGMVFIHCSTNKEERAVLEMLLSQIKTICSIVGDTGRTGLRIVRELELNCNSSLCVIFSLNEVVSLSDKELETIKGKIDRELDSHC
ncbi:hypothetical protein KKC00_02940 [Patescibacteria group bacterium]|nr:hypothetical protein [Patescibacteria group bacterium]